MGPPGPAVRGVLCHGPAVPCSAVQCYAAQCSAPGCAEPLQCRAVPYYALQCCAVRCDEFRGCHAARCSAMQFNATPCSAAGSSAASQALLCCSVVLCCALGAVRCGAMQRRTPAPCRAVPWQQQDSWLSPCCCLPSAQGRPCGRAPQAHVLGGAQLRGSPHTTVLSRLCQHQWEPASHTAAGALPVPPEGGDPGHGGPRGGSACAVAPSLRVLGCGDNTRCGSRGPVLLRPPSPTQPGVPRGCVCASAPSAACAGAAGRCLTLPSLGARPGPCDWDGAPPAGTRTWLRGLARADVTQLSWQRRWHAA